MNFVKSYGSFLLALAVGMAILMFLLNVGKKLPVVGTFAGDAQSLVQQGHL